MMIEDLDTFVRFRAPESHETPAHQIVVIKALDPGHGAALVAARLQNNFDIWKHFDVRTRLPGTAPGPSRLFSYG